MKSVNLTPELYDYILKNSIQDDGILKELLTETESLEIPMIQISPDQAKFLYLLTKLMNVKNALEIGTLTGYSGIHIARGLADGGKLVTVDIMPEHSKVAEKYFDKCGLKDRVQFVVSPALDYLKQLISEGRKFDLIFIDADKTNYRNYYEDALKLSHPGTVMIFDNMLKGGRVIDPNESDPDLEAIREMNKILSEDGRIEIVIMTIGDGFALCRVN